MAGLGRKLFTRERATISDVQGYLMDQTVMVFPSANARAVKVPSPSAGMHSYLEDAMRREVYEDDGWRFAGYYGPPGSISEPNARLRKPLPQQVSNNILTTISEYTIAKPSSSVSVASNGEITLNERGLWVISAQASSDSVNTGSSYVVLTSTARDVPRQSTAFRGSGFSGSGVLIQGLAPLVHYAPAGTKITLVVRNFNPSDSSAQTPYFADVDVTLIG